MCLAIPGRLVEVGEQDAVVDLDGVRRKVSTILLAERPAPGDWVVVHVGFAITRLDAAEAETTLALLREAMREHDAGRP
ncbi:MAG: HypC/HybG/HupF family hydrogenase formation chaperone [Acidimicrobiia bacterium]|nr:HypC/HybG/HupF family hydrogenase formation chaperone [Acidimicrobiia bacterium]